MNQRMWWGYLHQNGKIILKPWFGDHKDYTTDCEGNEFVRRVVKPFAAPTYDTAMEMLERAIQDQVTQDGPQEYLGDGVYVKYDGFHVWLLANDFYNPTDRVALDPAVWRNLQDWVSKHAWHSKPPEPAAKDV